MSISLPTAEDALRETSERGPSVCIVSGGHIDTKHLCRSSREGHLEEKLHHETHRNAIGRCWS